jgi:hypothetical protein
LEKRFADRTTCVSTSSTRNGQSQEIHARQRGNPNYTPRPFVAPLGSGTYGRFDRDVARVGFARLQELGIIEPANYDLNHPHLPRQMEFRWTEYGWAVSERLLAEHPLDEVEIQQVLDPRPSPR